MGFYAPDSGWLSTWGLGIGLLEQSGNLSLVVPWFDVSHLFRVVVRLPFCPTPPILTCPALRLLKSYGSLLPCASGPFLHPLEQKEACVTGVAGHRLVNIQIVASHLWPAPKSSRPLV